MFHRGSTLPFFRFPPTSVAPGPSIRQAGNQVTFTVETSEKGTVATEVKVVVPPDEARKFLAEMDLLFFCSKFYKHMLYLSVNAFPWF